MAKRNSSARLADYRVRRRIRPGRRFAPSGCRAAGASTSAASTTRARPFSSGDKGVDKAAVTDLAVELDHLQDLFYADRRFKLLVVLQGTDTSGKDGTIRGVFGEMSALGVHTAAWKAPTADELAHDYLWRIHAKVPAAGEVMIFNRSHYEDVLIPVARRLDHEAETAQRYAQINDFERMLVENGTLMLKFFLHISKDEQRLRLQARLDDPTKHWKFAVGDLEDRKLWDKFSRPRTRRRSPPPERRTRPGQIVPADSKTHRNLIDRLFSQGLLLRLKLRYPPRDPGAFQDSR